MYLLYMQLSIFSSLTVFSKEKIYLPSHIFSIFQINWKIYSEEYS